MFSITAEAPEAEGPDEQGQIIFSWNRVSFDKEMTLSEKFQGNIPYLSDKGVIFFF